MSELPSIPTARVHAVGLAIEYYRSLAKTRMILPKRDDADLAVELEPKMHELLTAAEQIECYILDGKIPDPDPT